MVCAQLFLAAPSAAAFAARLVIMGVAAPFVASGGSEGNRSMFWIVWIEVLNRLAPIFAVVACLAAIHFLLTPLMMSAAFHLEANPTINVIDPVEVPLPPVVQDHFSQVDAELHRRGFEDRGTSLLPSAAPNVTTFVRSYTNGSARISAMTTSMFWMMKTKPAAGIKHVAYVAFTTRYEGGEVFTTHNARIPGSFPRQPQTLKVRIPWIADVGQLYDVHLAITNAKASRGRKRLLLDHVYGGDVAAYAQGVMREEMEQAADAGYLRLTRDGTQYVKPLRGAYLMAWKQMPPIKQLLARRDRRRVQPILHEVGVGEMMRQVDSG
jgi:hypothetical protein